MKSPNSTPLTGYACTYGCHTRTATLWSARAALLGGALALAIGSAAPAFAQDDSRQAQPMGADRGMDTMHRDDSTYDRRDGEKHEKMELDEDITAEDFVETASALGFAEIETANTALENSNSSDIQAFAQLMIQDHTAANRELRALASKADLEMSSDAALMDKAKDMVLKLRDGDSFDRAYVENQVKAHKKTIQLFESAAKYLDDAELKQFAEKTLPTLKAHLDQAKQLKMKYGDGDDRRMGDGDRRTGDLPRYE